MALLPTIWLTDPFFKKIIVDILRAGECDGGVNVQTQFKDLIEGPYTTHSQDSLMRVSVVVINVLDECNRSSEQGITYWNLSSVGPGFPTHSSSSSRVYINWTSAKLWQMLATSWFWRLGTSSQIPPDIRLLLETRFEKSIDLLHHSHLHGQGQVQSRNSQIVTEASSLGKQQPWISSNGIDPEKTLCSILTVIWAAEEP